MVNSVLSRFTSGKKKTVIFHPGAKYGFVSTVWMKFDSVKYLFSGGGWGGGANPSEQSQTVISVRTLHLFTSCQIQPSVNEVRIAECFIFQHRNPLHLSLIEYMPYESFVFNVASQHNSFPLLVVSLN